jgi:CrcB protein
MPSTLSKLLIVAAGGAVGAVLRYLVAMWVQRLGDGFPIGTLTVNLIGCLAIGIGGAVMASPYIIREEYRLAVFIGLLGAFTTFSTFGYETFELFNDRQFARGMLNIALSNGLGLLGVWLGYRLTEHWLGV